MDTSWHHHFESHVTIPIQLLSFFLQLHPMTTAARLQSLEEATWSLKPLQTPAVPLRLIKIPSATN